LMGIAPPALATFTVGRLSTGAKKPLKTKLAACCASKAPISIRPALFRA
jgi:hypothetical protein